MKHSACVGRIWVQLRKNEFPIGNMPLMPTGLFPPPQWFCHVLLVWVRVQVDMNKIIKDEWSTGLQTVILSQQIINIEGSLINRFWWRSLRAVWMSVWVLFIVLIFSFVYLFICLSEFLYFLFSVFLSIARHSSSLLVHPNSLEVVLVPTDPPLKSTSAASVLGGPKTFGKTRKLEDQNIQ